MYLSALLIFLLMLYIFMDFPIYIDTISSVLPILDSNLSQVEVSKL